MLGKLRTQACFSSELGHFHFLGLGLFVGWVVWGLLLMLFQAKRPGSSGFGAGACPGIAVWEYLGFWLVEGLDLLFDICCSGCIMGRDWGR